MPKRIKTDDRFVCTFCNQLFKTKEAAEEHEKGHDLVYVPFERADLKRLLAVIKTGNFDYMTEHLLDTLLQFDKL